MKPLVVCYGVGVDSTAVLVGLRNKGIVPGLIIFADTSGEWPETYEYLEYVQGWLREVGFPPVVVVRYEPRTAVYRTLEEECLHLGLLPSIAYGPRKCSIKYKHTPQERYVRTWGPAVDTWATGGKVTRAIGFDAGESQRHKRAELALAEETDGRFYQNWYPLMEWGWTRADCVQQIANAGLRVPQKSACFF